MNKLAVITALLISTAPAFGKVTPQDCLQQRKGEAKFRADSLCEDIESRLFNNYDGTTFRYQLKHEYQCESNLIENVCPYAGANSDGCVTMTGTTIPYFGQGRSSYFSITRADVDRAIPLLEADGWKAKVSVDGSFLEVDAK